MGSFCRGTLSRQSAPLASDRFQQEKTVFLILKGYFPISHSPETTPVRSEPAECSRRRGSRRLSLRQARKRRKKKKKKSSILVCINVLLFYKAHFPQRDCLCSQVMRKYLKVEFSSHFKLISDRLNINRYNLGKRKLRLSKDLSVCEQSA